MSEKISFYKVSAIAGSGKTFKAITRAIHLAETGELVIIAVPSIQKVQELENTIKHRSKGKDSFTITAITSNDEDIYDSVSDRITEATGNAYFGKMEFGRGNIIICTHEGFLVCSRIDKKEFFHLYWDEAHTVFQHISGPMLESFRKVLLDDLLNITEYNDFLTADVKTDCVGEIKNRLKSNSIGIRDSKETRGLTGHLLSNVNGFCDILLNKNYEDKEMLDVIFMYNYLPFVGYKETIILGALLEHTNLYKWFIEKDVEFKDHPDFKNISANQTHPEKVKVYYANLNQRHSRAFLDKVVGDISVRDHFREAVLKEFNHTPMEEKMLVMCNNDNKFHAESIHYRFGDKNSRFVRCPWNNEGMNKFRNLNYLLYIGSFNPNSQYHKLINHFGIDDFGAYYHLYQTLMRLSIREGKDIAIFIPCLSLFEPLRDYFPNAELIPMDVCEEIMNWKDQRRKEVQLDKEWYLMTKSNMKKYGIPYHNTIKEYVSWFEKKGYKQHTIHTTKVWNNRRTSVSKSLIVYEFPDAIEKAQRILESREPRRAAAAAS